MIYLDYSATSPMFEECMEVLLEASKNFYGNTESLHDIGCKSKELLEGCRQTLANQLGVRKDTIFFTSGGSESNYIALRLLIQNLPKGKNHIISTSGEHSSIKNSLKLLEEQGFSITEIPFNRNGIIDIKQLEQQITAETGLVVIHHVNSEIGTIQPIQTVGDLLKKKNIFLHSDCVQSFGKLDLSEITPYVDSLSFTSHKINGPKGIGALYVSPKHALIPLIPGTVHESGIRPGTLNVPAIASFVQASIKWHENRQNYNDQFSFFHKQIYSCLDNAHDLIDFFGATLPTEQLPSIFSFRIKGLEGQYVLLEMNKKGIAVSSGSACQLGNQAPSSTIMACGFDETAAKGLVRVSMGPQTTESEIDQLCKSIIEICETV